MKGQSRLALTLLAGIAIGGTVVGAWAQGKLPAYYVAQIELIGDADAYIKGYASQVPGTLKPFGGRFLARGGKVTALEGDAPAQRIAIIAFDSVEKAQAWYNSPAYQKIAPVRQSLAKTNSFIVEGLPQGNQPAQQPSVAGNDFPSKMQKIQNNLPTYLSQHPDQQSNIAALMPQLDTYLKASDIANATKIADQILTIIGQ